MKTHRGTILYTSKHPDRMDRERGREHFTLTEQPDGLSTLHAHCEIDDAPSVTRDVLATFDTKTVMPVGAALRLMVGGRFEGSGTFHFSDAEASCWSRNVRDGNIQQTIEHPDITWFGHHAITGDGTLARLIPDDAEPGGKTEVRALMSSPDHRGATGPMLFPLTFSVVFEGDETVTTPAGSFACRRFSVTDTQGLPDEHPPYRIWTDRETNIFVRGGVEGYMMTHYELVELHTTESPVNA